MDLGLKGKVAMVAGASRGLGYAVARGLAGEGVKVSMASRDDAKIQEASKRAGAETSSDTLGWAVDVRSAESIQLWFDKTQETFGGVDLLYINSGGPPAGTALSFDDAAWVSAFELMVLSAVRMARLVVPSMKSRGGGVIVIGTSSSVQEPVPNLALSNCVRASVAALSKTLSNELAADGIRVNQLLPGRIATDRLVELDTIRAKSTNATVDAVKAGHERNIPLGRYGIPSEFGSAAVFLFSSASSYITGASLQVDGGLIKHVF